MKTLKIIHDEDYDSPRDWDNLGTMVCFHRNYQLGNKHKFNTPEDFLSEIDNNNHVILPLYLYDHSGITISTTPFSCPWDSGQVGWIYVSKEKIRQEGYGQKVTKKIIEKIKDILKAEIKTYDQYLTGEVFSFIVEENGEIVDSCGGFYGRDWEENGIKDYIPEELHSQLKDIEITYPKFVKVY